MIAKTFCISHKPIYFDVGANTQIIWLGSHDNHQPDHDQQLHVSDISMELDAWHNFLSGCAGTFAIRNFIDQNPMEFAGKSISIIQYRKFIAKQALGEFAANYHGMVLIPKDEANLMDIDAIQADIQTPFLVSQPAGLGNLYMHYAKGHHIQDLLRYIAIAIDLEVITPEESNYILQSDWIFPGGIEFGIFETAFFVETIKKLESVSFRFLEMHRPTSMDPYQRRALAFCNERLGSYFLRKHITPSFLTDPLFPTEYLGFMHTVSETINYSSEN